MRIRGGVRGVGRRLDCSDFGGGLGSRPFYIALGTWALSSRGDVVPLPLGFLTDWIPTALCLLRVPL